MSQKSLVYHRNNGRVILEGRNNENYYLQMMELL